MPLRAIGEHPRPSLPASRSVSSTARPWSRTAQRLGEQVAAQLLRQAHAFGELDGPFVARVVAHEERERTELEERAESRARRLDDLVQVERGGKGLRDTVQRDEQLVGRRQPRDLVPRGFLVQTQLVDEAARERADHPAEQEQDADLGRGLLRLRIVALGDDHDHEGDEAGGGDARGASPTDVVAGEHERHRGDEDERAREPAGDRDDAGDERGLDDDRDVQGAARWVEMHGAQGLRDAVHREGEAAEDEERTGRSLDRDGEQAEADRSPAQRRDERAEAVVEIERARRT